MNLSKYSGLRVFVCGVSRLFYLIMVKGLFCGFDRNMGLHFWNSAVIALSDIR